MPCPTFFRDARESLRAHPSPAGHDRASGTGQRLLGDGRHRIGIVLQPLPPDYVCAPPLGERGDTQRTALRNATRRLSRAARLFKLCPGATEVAPRPAPYQPPPTAGPRPRNPSNRKSSDAHKTVSEPE